MTRHALHPALAKRSANGTHWQSNGLTLRRNITAQLNGEPMPVTHPREDEPTSWNLICLALIFACFVLAYVVVP